MSSIENYLAIEPLTGIHSIQEPLKSAQGRLVAWWYGGIKKNPRAASQPLVAVVFRKLKSNSTPADYIVKLIPLTSLGQVRLGTIWEGGRCVGRLRFHRSDFTVDFRVDKWRFNSFYSNDTPPPYPRNVYPLMYNRDKNPIIEFDLEHGGKLLIPSTEFFSRCYGQSQELKRILATYPWKGPEEDTSRLYGRQLATEDSGSWHVTLKESSNIVGRDAVFLAWAKYDRYTLHAAKSIYAQMEANSALYRGKPALSFPQIGPWFEQSANVRVTGIPFDDGKSFLALNILGCSRPSGPPITTYRPSSNNEFDEKAKNESGANTNVVRGSSHRRPGQEFALTGDYEPNKHASTHHFEDLAYIELDPPSGQSAQIIRASSNGQNQRQIPIQHSNTNGVEGGIYAGGSRRGHKKDIDRAMFNAPIELESRGILRDMWHAVNYLRDVLPDRVTEIHWFTFENGFSSETEPKLIALRPFQHDEVVKKPVRDWPYKSRDSIRLRGALVMHIEIDNESVYILEIERSLRTTPDSPDRFEAPMKGLVFTLNDQNQLKPWLISVLSKVRLVEGVLDNLELTCNGRYKTFNHRSSDSDTVPCESAVRNALKKMGIYI